MEADPADIAAKITISDEALQASYEKYKPDFATPESRVIEQIVFPTIEEAKKAKGPDCGRRGFPGHRQGARL